jgi:hypothetical protein
MIVTDSLIYTLYKITANTQDTEFSTRYSVATSRC